jgi:hypothetical protein
MGFCIVRDLVAHSDFECELATEVLSSQVGHPAFAFVLGAFYLRPIGGAEGDA